MKLLRQLVLAASPRGLILAHELTILNPRPWPADHAGSIHPKKTFSFADYYYPAHMGFRRYA